MITKDFSKFNSFKLPLDHLEENEDIVKNNAPLMAAIATAKSYVSGILFHNEVATAKSGGAVEGKKFDQGRLAENAYIVAGAISSWAATQGNEELKEAMNFSRSELTYGTDKEITERCGLIKTNAEKFKDALAAAGYSATLLDNFIRTMNDFGNSVNRPRELKVEKKEARGVVKRLIKECDKHFKEHLDKLLASYKPTDRSFHDQYLLKRVIINPPTRHTALAGKVTDQLTGEPLEGVLIMAEKTQLVTKSVTAGEYNLRVPRYGEISVEFKKEGYKEQIKTVRLLKGQVTEVNIQLEKV